MRGGSAARCAERLRLSVELSYWIGSLCLQPLARRSLALPFGKPAAGKAKPYRTSGGKAASALLSALFAAPTTRDVPSPCKSFSKKRVLQNENSNRQRSRRL